MRASASGAFDFTGLRVEASDIIGDAEDYHAQPAFSAGAWRFCAVQLGGIERLLDCTRQHLRDTGRDADPAQLMRVGQAATAAQGARLWVEAAARRAEHHRDEDPQALIAFVNLTRGAVERAGLDVIELTQRSIGLQGFLRTHAVEHVVRDLATYLRQPAPDKALMDAAAHVVSRSSAARDVWRS
jgi:alkylation response protein AidB-like acyl-CoA dehydrogenase